ncbi:hypothetical protein LR48_Vigan03g150400 [Vigna angularis]|uniref:Uncharacterized protein n=1 Tax=Phaseolus angularis TaxID=3914 RepID=A0A0L9U640_PHAAN|nr:hypothetical protein LR48_Vigan03g150400 [Vigna angularis]
MASGLVRIALECDKDKESEKKSLRLLQESVWRTYWNGKKCGFATRRECGAKDWEILKAVEPISMGAGVLLVSNNSDGGDVHGANKTYQLTLRTPTFRSTSIVFFALNYVDEEEPK